MIFHKGRLPELDKNFQFSYNGEPLERVTSFTYLGFNFSPQLSFSNHVLCMVAKARRQIGMLHRQLNIRDLSLDIVLQLFYIYVLPIFRYGAGLWLSSCSKASLSSIDTTFTKFLKGYLGLPNHTNNAIVYLLTDTAPISLVLRYQASSLANGLCYPSCLSGLKLSFLTNIPSPESFPVHELVPSFFWRSRVVVGLPSNFHYRRAICRDVCDIIHYDLCNNQSFHCQPTLECVCKLCGEKASAYHHYDCAFYSVAL